MVKIGNIGALTNGVEGLWRVETIWAADEVLILQSIENESVEVEAYIEEFWPLLDSF